MVLFFQLGSCLSRRALARPHVPLLRATDEADANLDEYLPDGTPMTAVYRSLLLNLPTALR